MVRLIDADALLDKQESLYMKGNVLFHGVTACAIENAPTIDPETLPIVRELQAEIERLEKSCETWRSRTRKLLADAREISDGLNRAETELERMTAERDAAIEDLRLFGHKCNCCKHFDRPFTCIAPEPCGVNDNWEWRGPVAENATTESEVQTNDQP